MDLYVHKPKQNRGNQWTVVHTPGKKFGDWEIVKYAGLHVFPSGERRAKYKVKCKCGTVKEIIGASLTRKHASTNCGCHGKPARRRKLEKGQKFGRWEVTSEEILLKQGKDIRAYYEVKCECGTERRIIASALFKGVSKSCGCLRKDLGTLQLEKYRHLRHVKRDHQSPISEIPIEPLGEPIENKESSLSKRLRGRDLLGQLASTVKGVC